MLMRLFLVVVGAALVGAGAAWVMLVFRNLPEFHNAGGVLGAAVLGGLPGLSALGTGLFLWRLAAARYPGSI